MLFNDLQFLNAISSIRSTTDGSVTLSNARQSLNTAFSINFTPPGTEKLRSARQPLNPPSPIDFTPAPFVTSANRSAFEKANAPISSVPSGMSIFCNPQCANAPPPICFSPEGSSASVSASQKLNAYPPMLFSPFPKRSPVKEAHRSKALFPMLSAPSPIAAVFSKGHSRNAYPPIFPRRPRSSRFSIRGIFQRHTLRSPALCPRSSHP